MLSDKGYMMLRLIMDEKSDKVQDFDTFTYLETQGFISYDGRKCAYVTPHGEEACKEYELKSATKECAEEANNIAKNTDKKLSRRGWWQFAITTAISIAAAIISLIALIKSFK